MVSHLPTNQIIRRQCVWTSDCFRPVSPLSLFVSACLYFSLSQTSICFSVPPVELTSDPSLSLSVSVSLWTSYFLLKTPLWFLPPLCLSLPIYYRIFSNKCWSLFDGATESQSHQDNHSIREQGMLGEDSSICFSHCWFSSGSSCSFRAPVGCWRSSFPKWWRSCWPPYGIRCCVRLSPSWHAHSWWRSSSSTLTTGPRWRRWPPPTTTEPSRSSPRDARAARGTAGGPDHCAPLHKHPETRQTNH